MARNNLGPSWSHYDREFCIQKQLDPLLPWGKMHLRLYFQLLEHFSLWFKPEAQMAAKFTAPNMLGILGGSPTEAMGVFRKGYCFHSNLHGACQHLNKCAALLTGVHSAMLQATQLFDANPIAPPHSHPSHALLPEVNECNVVITPVLPKCLQVFLQHAPMAPFLVGGFTFGFHIPHITVSLPLILRDHSSAYEHASFLNGYIHDELPAHHILHHFHIPSSNFRCFSFRYYSIKRTWFFPTCL